MPGKSQASSRGKQDSSRERLSSAKSNNDSARKVCIWPVWSDNDVEKQDQAVSGKGRDKSKAAHAPILHEDPEGVVLPPSLINMGHVCWKRPTDMAVVEALGSEEPAIVKDHDCTNPDLISSNTHIMHSKFVSWMVSELGGLWRVGESLPSHSSPDEETKTDWTPWAHIYPQSKTTIINPMGKYYVKLFWMGAWRKVTIDDYLPFLDKKPDSEEGQSDNDRYLPLYLRTTRLAEIWPALIMKALLKVAALDSVGGEFGDFSITHLLTGWTPQIIPLDPCKRDTIWKDLLVPSLPLWVRGSEENGRGSRDCVVLASFRETTEKEKEIFDNEDTVEATLKEAGVLSSTFDQTTTPVFPLLLTQARDEPLIPPPDTPPPPVLQFPYYLGLKNRQGNPSEVSPPSTPPPEAPWFLEIAPREVGVVKKEVSTEEEEEEDGKKESDAVWMGYSDFLKCFSHLYIFRNPSSFKCRNTCVDTTRIIEEQTSVPPLKKGASSAQLISSSKVLAPLKDNNLLFVDSPQPTLLHFVLCSLSNWRDGGKNTHPVPLKTPFPRPEQCEGVVTGQLVVEAFHWNIVQTSSPLLRVKSTGTKGATLSLPAGRHVLKLHVKSPIAYHVGVFSNSEFQLTDEDNIYSSLSKESSLYTSFCSEFMQYLVSASSHFGDGGGLDTSLYPLLRKLLSVGLTTQHANLFLASVLEVWSSHSKEYGLTNAMLFAWKAFFYKSFVVLEQGLSPSGVTVDVQSMRRTLSKGGLVEQKTSNEGSSEISAQEQKAASVITRTLQRHINSRRRQSMRPGTSSNEQAVQEIEKSISSLEPHLTTMGLEVFNSVLNVEPSLKPLFPFHDDESRRCFSTLYNGSFPPLPPHGWTLVLRLVVMSKSIVGDHREVVVRLHLSNEATFCGLKVCFGGQVTLGGPKGGNMYRAVFQVPTPQTVVPHFTCPIPSYLLRVINNDTMTELPRLFHSTTPMIYTPNANGYTVQVEAWSGDMEGVDGGGRWGLRLVSSSEQQPVLVGGETELVTPHTQEFIDYCLPDRDHVLFRYTLTASKDLPVSLQLSVSKHDTCCKLQILDNEVPMCEVEGRKLCIIPLHYLQASTEEETSESHKYVVQAVVLRDSWPLPETAWPHISVIRSSEKLDDKQDTKPGSAKKGRSKGAASKKGNTPSNAQMSQGLNNIDASKPHWILRVATNANDKDQLTVAKDTEKADALRAMVQAWESEQPGRSQKALESRRKFLESRGVNGDQSMSSEGQSPYGPLKIQQMDLTPFVVNEGPPQLLDEAEQELRLQERQKLFKDYRSMRQGMLEQRNNDREARNEAKLKQLEMAETWQIDLDQLRNKLNSGREAIRERHLKKEKAKLEAEQAQQEEPVPSATGRDSKAAKAKGGKGKKK